VTVLPGDPSEDHNRRPVSHAAHAIIDTPPRT
jgi:hypothetical protein